ncbi:MULTISPECIES: S41 family peptidase [Mesoflavibacter]|uniref:S41 family peptidase n=1 Tax=Mesoflavibacter profundi TaxID=2708110 RepID=A0ABT4S1L7_9FLAO|nr:MULTISPECIES: S41 family peptidase [Mesoflavibacter]MDA0177963.1 S41 family peptidase [Mesoflavibacter profundi]QIJ88923.1 Carboxy-terminal processing protease [Mesoflavibacter sp. HG96]QIJ91651.1 Carboxy-terminal processing protease [Mesoflavibacter sp. HG37]
MKKIFKKRILIPVFALTIFITGSAFKSDFFEIAKQIEIFTTLFKELNMNYVDETNPADLMDNAIKNMLNDLDPYTKFYNEQDVEAERIRRTGDYTGVGAKIRTLKDKLVVVEPYKDYPADKAGLKAGDEIIEIDGIKVDGYEDDASNLLKGAPNSTLNVTYKRQGKTNTTTLTRSEIEINAVPHFSMINETTGYIVLQKFNAKASMQTEYALKDLKAQGAKSIILDLRNNPGGLLREAINIVNLFVPKGQLVVTTKSKVKKYNKTYYTKQEPIDTKIPVVVLINGRSASASEIVSGALQDLDRAVIVGARSFGKGLVQRPKKLTYGTQLKVTISRYYTPSGRCIQSLDYWNRDENGNAVRIKQENYHEFKTKNGRKVYDGGGVFPDEALETTKNSAITDAILNSQAIFDFATQFYYNNSIENINNFQLSDSDFNAFKAHLKTSSFEFETETEKALKKALEVSKTENLDDDIKKEYNNLQQHLEQVKIKTVDQNKTQLVNLLTDEIVKRYVYREGLYEYYKINNQEIKTATQILANPNQYNKYLN